MPKVNRVQQPLTLARQHSQKLLSVLMITATATYFFSSLSVPSVVGQTASPQAEPRGSEQTSILDAILKLLKRDEPALGSRGNLCAINPALLGETNILWNTRPLFLWQGDVRHLEVRPYSLDSSYENQVVLWSQSVMATAQSATYTGKALQPGQTYEWESIVVDPGDPSSRSKHRFTFQVMEATKRARIKAELTALETRLKAAGVTDEAIALQRANYFAEHHLWSDALQEVFSVKNPSAALTQSAREMTAYLCES